VSAPKMYGALGAGQVDVVATDTSCGRQGVGVGRGAHGGLLAGRGPGHTTCTGCALDVHWRPLT